MMYSFLTSELNHCKSGIYGFKWLILPNEFWICMTWIIGTFRAKTVLKLLYFEPNYLDLIESIRQTVLCFSYNGTSSRLLLQCGKPAYHFQYQTHLRLVKPRVEVLGMALPRVQTQTLCQTNLGDTYDYFQILVMWLCREFSSSTVSLYILNLRFILIYYKLRLFFLFSFAFSTLFHGLA